MGTEIQVNNLTKQFGKQGAVQRQGGCSPLGWVESSLGACEDSPPVGGGTLVAGALGAAAPPGLAPPTVILPCISGFALSWYFTAPDPSSQTL